MILTQSMADLDLCYGEPERRAMMNNFRFKVVLGASDTDTQKYFAELIGYVVKKKESVAKSNGKTTRTTSEANVYAIEPAKLDHLKNNLIVLHPDGYYLLKKNFYYKWSCNYEIFNNRNRKIILLGRWTNTEGTQ